MDDSETWLDSPWLGGLPVEDKPRASVFCGVASNDSRLCALVPGHDGRHGWEVQEGPHDLVIKDILSRNPGWDVSVGSARHIRDRVADDLLKLKNGKPGAAGVTWQVSPSVQPLLNAYRSLLVAVTDVRARLLEIPADGLEYLVLFEAYDDLVSHAVRLRRVLDTATE